MLMLSVLAPAILRPVAAPSHRKISGRTADVVCSGVKFGRIHHVAVPVGSLKDAVQFYSRVLGMSNVTEVDGGCVPEACVRVGEQTIHLLETASPDPIQGRPHHAGRDRHVAISVHDLAPLKASLESNGVLYTLSQSGRDAIFCRDTYGNGWEFAPAETFRYTTRQFAQFLTPVKPEVGLKMAWGGMPHVGILGSDVQLAKKFYCGVLGMVDETDLRPSKLPFPGLFLRCGEQQVHFMQLLNPDVRTVSARPSHGMDRRTAYSIDDLAPLRIALKSAGIPYRESEWRGTPVVYCRDPDTNELMFMQIS